MCTQTQILGTKTIGLDEEAYERLRAQKREGESFVVTRNVEDFERFEGVAIESY